MLDMTVRRQDQGLSCLTTRQGVEVLRRQGVQPGEPILATDSQDAAVRAINDPAGLDQPPLLTERIAVVCRYPGIDPDAGYGA
jgi:hypothetical protein